MQWCVGDYWGEGGGLSEGKSVTCVLKIVRGISHLLCKGFPVKKRGFFTKISHFSRKKCSPKISHLFRLQKM